MIEGGGEFIDELQDGEPINWGAVAARTVGGGAKGAMFSVPGLGTAKLATGTVGIATAENYLHSAAKGDVSAETLGKVLANGTIEGLVAGLVDAAAKKVLGIQPHAEPKSKPELQMEPMTEAGQGSYLKPNIQLFSEGVDKYANATFASREKLLSHYAKHGGEFKGLFNSADEYLDGARSVINNGYRVEYLYKGETRIGFVQFLGNSDNGSSIFAFVGTNNNGHITTFSPRSSSKFWRMLNGDSYPVINPK